jgi:hypothetical protein
MYKKLITQFKRILTQMLKYNRELSNLLSKNFPA